MNCICPKCNAQIEVDLPSLAEEGTDAKCPACSARFRLAKESFAMRALRSSESLVCVHCGNALGHATYCPECRELFPDYLVAETGKQRKKKVNKTLSRPSILTGASLPSGAMPRASVPRSASTAAKPRTRVSLLTLLVIVVLVVVAGMFIYQQRVQGQYVRDYMRALNLLKGATEGSLAQCTRLATDWKARADAGQTVVPRLAATDEALLVKVKGNVDGLMTQFKEPPGKFAKANEKLVAVYGVYAKSYTLATAPPGSLQALTDATTRTGAELKQVLVDLKTNLSPALQEEFQSARSKYRGLRDF